VSLQPRNNKVIIRTDKMVKPTWGLELSEVKYCEFTDRKIHQKIMEKHAEINEGELWTHFCCEILRVLNHHQKISEIVHDENHLILKERIVVTNQNVNMVATIIAISKKFFINCLIT